MEDSDGQVHRSFVPKGKVKQLVWNFQVRKAESSMTPAFLELVKNTQQPFICNIRDSKPPKAAFMSGRYLLVGEAMNLLRPHPGMATNQAAMQSLLLREVFTGKTSIQEWEHRVLAAGKMTALLSKTFGHYFMSSRLTYYLAMLRYLLFLVWQKIGTIRKRFTKL